MISAIIDPAAVVRALQVGFFGGLIGCYLLRMYFIRCKWVYVGLLIAAAVRIGAAKSIVTCIFTLCNALIVGNQSALIVCAGAVGAVLACLLPCYKVRTLFLFGKREPRGQQLPANTAQQAQQVQQAQQAPAPVRNRRRGWSW